MVPKDSRTIQYAEFSTCRDDYYGLGVFQIPVIAQRQDSEGWGLWAEGYGMEVAANIQMRSWSSAGKDENCETVMLVVVVACELAWETLSSSSNFSALSRQRRTWSLVPKLDRCCGY